MRKLQGFLQKRMSGWSPPSNPSELCASSCWGYHDGAGPLRKAFRNVSQLCLTDRAYWQVSRHNRMGGDWIWPMWKDFGLKIGINNSNTESICVNENLLCSKPHNQLTWHCPHRMDRLALTAPAGVWSSDAPKSEWGSSSQEMWAIWKH